MFSCLEEVYVRPSAFKKITISGLAIALGISVGLLMTQSSSRAQQQKEKGKGGRSRARSSAFAELFARHRRASEKPRGRRLADDSPHL